MVVRINYFATGMQEYLRAPVRVSRTGSCKTV